MTIATLPVPLRSNLLSGVPGIRHGLTYRVAGMGEADGNVGMGSPRDKDDAWAMRQAWCATIGVDPERIVTMGQLHGNDVIRVTADDAGKGARPFSEHAGFADVMITDDPDLVLMTLHADCQPILLVDPSRPAIAAVHAGWRGTVADAGGAAVAAMVDAFGSRPDQLLAFLGPAIGPCCNEVGDEVIDAWYTQTGGMPDAVSAVQRPGPKAHFDVPRANVLLLMRSGVRPEHIETSSICTVCEKDSWFSHRGHGAGAGREGALISIARSAS